MAMLQFNANDVPPDKKFDPIPAGWYNVMIVDSEIKPNSAGTGNYLQLTVRVVDGQFAGRQIFDTLNISHPNAVAQDIAQKKLSAYCHATGVMQLNDSQQLHGIPLAVRVTIKNDPTGQYDPRNEVKAVKSVNEGPGPSPTIGAPMSAPALPPVARTAAPAVPHVPQQAAPAPSQAPAPAAMQATGKTPPWAKRNP